MRTKKIEQLTFSDYHFSEIQKLIPVSDELKKMDSILKDNPEVIHLVHSDLTKGRTETGRNGCSSEQALRCAILKQHSQLSYRDFAKRLHDCISYRWFTQFGPNKIPHFTKLQKMIKHIKAGTWELINDIFVLYARKKKVENGKSLRTDTSATESDIAYPIDARLLWDSVRVLTRLMKRSMENVAGLDFAFHNRTRSAKRLCFSIVMTKGKNAEKKRRQLYRRLIGVTNEVFAMAAQCLKQLDDSKALEASALADRMDHFLTMCAVALEQCERRVLKGEKVPSDEKIVSIFEEHTDIIVRGKARKPVEFGHKVLFATGKSGIVTQFRTLKGNPDDGGTFLSVLDKHEAQYGAVPRSITADRKYFSSKNEKAAQDRGVKNVSIRKPGYVAKERKTKEKTRIFKGLQRFRAGVEGIISALMRRFGLRRCNWKGWEAFQNYVGLSVVTFNLRKIAALL